MEAAEKTLPYRDDTGPYKKLLHGNKDKCSTETKNDSKYVDLDDLLDLKSKGTKPKVMHICDGNQLTVFKANSDSSGVKSPSVREFSDNIDKIYEEHSKDNWADWPVSEDPPMDTSLTKCNSKVDLGYGNSTEFQTKIVRLYCHVPSEFEELQYTDMYLNSKTEMDDSGSVVLTDNRVPDIIQDESHYITTHEIQLTELDHDLDYDSGRDIEDDNLVYSFVDYASFESNETTEGTLILEGRNQARCNNAHLRAAGCAVASTESELCDSDKCASSDESMCRNQYGSGNSEGQIHLSIKTSSRAINESNNVLEKERKSYHTKNVGSRSQLFFTSTDANSDAICDRSQYFIPAPGRQHLATKLRGKDLNEYSSGASSSISELDDADKEVRNLTARSFRSLACPYFDAINLSTSSESSLSEYGLGLNKWSAFVDLSYGNMSQSREQNRNTHKSATATFEMSKNAEFKRLNRMAISKKKGSQTNILSLNKNVSSPQHATTSTQNADFTCPFQPSSEVITLTKTLNFCCNVEAGSPERGNHIRSSDKDLGSRSMDNITASRPAKAGYEVSLQHINEGEIMEATNKKASFASNLLTNVISKKMQLEQERKMERGEIRDTHQTHSPCFHCKDLDGIRDRRTGRCVYGKYSDMGLGYTSNSVDEEWAVDSIPNSCDHKEVCTDALESLRSTNEAGLKVPKDACELIQEPLSHSENSAFKSWKEGSMLQPKDKELRAQVPVNTSALIAQNEQWTGERHLRSDTGVTGGNVKGSNAPEIKIRLRSFEENKGNLNIANLLTPNVSYPVKTAADRVPHFTVRDIRDNKCTFQTPIHQVRDVRKLVKSSYPLDNSESKCTVAPPVTELQEKTTFKQKSDKNFPSSSVVIKCQSVNTNSSNKQPGLVRETPKRRQCENDQSSPKQSPECAKNEHAFQHRVTGRPRIGFTKHPNTEAKYKQEKIVEADERKMESKILNQAALEKLKAAVKTMEQLYVYDRNEWKRKSQAPRPITDSHVLSLIANEEHGGPKGLGAAGGSERLSTETNTGMLPETSKFQEKNSSLSIMQVPSTEETFKTQSQESKTFNNKSVFHLGSTFKTAIASSSSGGIDLSQTCFPSQTTSVVKSISSTSLTAPMSINIFPPKRALVDRGTYKSCPTPETLPQPIISGNPDSENYLTIPVESMRVSEIKLQNSNLEVTGSSFKTSKPSITNPKRTEQHSRQSLKQSPEVMEMRTVDTATIYHHSLPVAIQEANQPHVFCFSPTGPPLPTTPPRDDAFQLTQRKMLLDPTTGHYYLVDTPVQLATRRLFDPESGQYVDMAIPQPLPVKTVPVSPLTLSQGGVYNPTYMIYPGFLSSTLGAQVVMEHQVASQVAPHLKAEDKTMETGHGKCISGHVGGQAGNMAGAESPYYSTTGGSEPASAPGYQFTSLGSVTASDGKPPVISITSQQGPRIIAPPSFDGTTMSFVVEHR
ncbi:uncharacterized protein C4orf54-like isoform X2 [Esox lucius]|uniref:uncharacterized protein C4orf54-like isoform X2 n=1 Tax=Esox lucius TaxID=8010 RepID=UPI001476B53D|nr:uncharacterized protein C4orf54-like isoform X2 [Esox lucius]